MFQHILVPLDGSSLAEQALPIAVRIAKNTGGMITLLRAENPAEGYIPYYHRVGPVADEIHSILIKEAQDYLEQMSHSDQLAGINVQTRLSTETAAQAILSYAQVENVDLLILNSHGYSGLERWAMGSVAQKVVRHSPAPVLVLREDDAHTSFLCSDETHPVRAIVALDGSSFAEAALRPAAQLVASLNPPANMGELHLVHIIKPPTDREERKYQIYDIDIREYQRNDADSYLHKVKGTIAKEYATALGMKITTSIVEDADTAEALIRIAEKGDSSETTYSGGYDLIALTTHGRGGLARWMVGSITERILERTKQPLLVIRPPESATSSTTTDKPSV